MLSILGQCPIFKSTNCLAIGHSFRDDYMRELLLEKIRQEKYKLTIIDPYAKSIKNKKFEKSRKVVPECMKIEDWIEKNLNDYVSGLSKK